jgi:hypothetical protein
VIPAVEEIRRGLDVLAEEAAELDPEGWQLYASLNEIDPALLARAPNKVMDRPEATTTDRDVTRRRYLLLDFDPVRPADVSATEEEKWAAYLKAKEVRKYLRDEGWSDPVIANSGNGFHFLYRVDLPNDQVTRELVKRVLEAVADHHLDPVRSGSSLKRRCPYPDHEDKNPTKPLRDRCCHPALRTLDTATTAR